MKKRSKLSVRTSALLLSAVLLLAGGTVTGARAAFNAQSDMYRARFYVNHLQVFLLENGEYACDLDNDGRSDNSAGGNTKVTGALATNLGYTMTEGGDETLGTVDPGRDYEEVIQARNGLDVPQYVRLTIRKYWLTEDGDKAVDLDPALIKLTYNGSVYNTEYWTAGEVTTESTTYYYKTPLAAGADTEPLFDTLTIDKSVVPDMHMPTDEELKSDEYAPFVTVTTTTEGKTVYTYTYKYDGYTFYIEADVQAVQTHNAQDAIHSQWGVYNVEVVDGELIVHEVSE